MTEAKTPKPETVVLPPVVLPFVRYTPKQVLQHKKMRDERRKAIRTQNADSKLMR